MIVLRNYERKNAFDGILAQNVYTFAEFDCVRHETAVLNLTLNIRIIGVEIEVFEEKFLIVALNDILVFPLLDIRYVI